MNYKKICDNNCIVKCPEHLLNKLHIGNKPHCKFLFTRNKLGKSIWGKTQANDDFKLFDSKISFQYDPLSDPYLKTFFKRKVYLNHLRKNNFITQNNEIICSVRDYNDYRQYLHRMKTEINAAEKRVENVVDIDLYRLKISKSLFEKKYKNNEKFRAKYGGEKKDGSEENPIRYESVMKTMRNRKLEKECQRKLKFMAAMEKYNNRINEIQQLQHQKKNLLKERAIRRNLEIVKKQIFVAEQQRKQQISLKRQIIAQDKAMQAKMVKRFNSQPKTVDFIVKCPVEV